MSLSKQKRVQLNKQIEKEMVQEVGVISLDQSLPKICQIGSSIEDIGNYAMMGEQVNVYPRDPETNSMKEKLYRQLQQISSSGMVYVSDNLSVSVNVKAKKKPTEVLFDVCLIIKDFSPFILSVVRQEHTDAESVIHYNLSLTREVIDLMRSFTPEPFSSLYGVLTDLQLETENGVIKALEDIQLATAISCIPRSLKVPGDKIKGIILSLLSSIALTRSLGDPDDSWWFLTLEQLVILTENIDKQEVFVRTKQSTGWKVLMREVAKRLEKSGPTLLVMESEEQLKVARDLKTCSFMMTLEEWMAMVMGAKPIKGMTNIVTNCQTCPLPSGITGRSWTFNPADEAKEKSETTTDESMAAEEKLSAISQSSLFSERCTDSGIGTGSNSLADIGSVNSVASGNILETRETSSGYVRPKKALTKVMQKIIVGQTKGPGNSTFEEDGKRTPVRDPRIPIYITHEGPLYLLTTRWKRSVPLLCRQHEMSRDHVNTNKCQMNEDGHLANGKAVIPSHQGHQRFKEYWGTCSSFPIPQSAPPSFPIHVPPTPQYWETETRVTGNWKLEWRWRAVLEVAVQEKDRLDSSVWVYGGPRSWCIRVGRCNTHKSSFCTQVWNQDEHVSCVTGTLSDTPDASQTLRYGVVVDVERGRLAFIDLEKGTVLAKIDVEFQQALYPVFGVYAYAFKDEATVAMRLLSGCDISVTDDKQKLIYSCLT